LFDFTQNSGLGSLKAENMPGFLLINIFKESNLYFNFSEKKIDQVSYHALEVEQSLICAS
jgi:hypothetical protein